LTLDFLSLLKVLIFLFSLLFSPHPAPLAGWFIFPPTGGICRYGKKIWVRINNLDDESEKS
jgi:hypothetical protein